MINPFKSFLTHGPLDYQFYVDQRLVVKEIIFKSQMVYYSNLISDSGSDHNNTIQYNTMFFILRG